MDVFVRGIPEGLSDEQFTDVVDPYLRTLLVTAYTFKRCNTRNCGVVTFADTKQALHFLERHGQSHEHANFRIPQPIRINNRILRFQVRSEPLHHHLPTHAVIFRTVMAWALAKA